MKHFFLNHEMFVCGSTYWNMANMCNLGHNMAFLLKAVCRETSYEKSSID